MPTAFHIFNMSEKVSGLPYDDSFGSRAEHLVAFLDVEGLEEGLDILESDVYAVFAE